MPWNTWWYHLLLPTTVLIFWAGNDLRFTKDGATTFKVRFSGLIAANQDNTNWSKICQCLGKNWLQNVLLFIFSKFGLFDLTWLEVRGRKIRCFSIVVFYWKPTWVVIIRYTTYFYLLYTVGNALWPDLGLCVEWDWCSSSTFIIHIILAFYLSLIITQSFGRS